MTIHRESDVVVIGGGPAGISACLELDRLSDLSITLLEAEEEVGGMPRTCGPGFGLRDQYRFLSGSAYARLLSGLLARTRVRVETGTTVLALTPGPEGQGHLIEAASPGGLVRHRCRRVILATGCFESSRESRLIPGDRPAGIMTTGTLQQLVKLRGLRPGRRALVLGTESVSLSAVLTLRRAGVELAGLVEEGLRPAVLPEALAAFRAAFGFPVHFGARVLAIQGRGRVEGVCLAGPDGEQWIACDTVIVSGRFRPDNALAESAGLALDQASQGPLVDQSLRTETPGVLAAGNLLRGADMHDLCALEGRLAARTLVRDILAGREVRPSAIPIRALPPVRFVVPQLIDPDLIGAGRPGLFSPACAIQLERTLIRPVLTVRSGERVIWRRRYARLIGRTRIGLPLHRFDRSGLDPGAGLTVSVG